MPIQACAHGVTGCLGDLPQVMGTIRAVRMIDTPALASNAAASAREIAVKTLWSVCDRVNDHRNLGRCECLCMTPSLSSSG